MYFIEQKTKDMAASKPFDISVGTAINADQGVPVLYSKVVTLIILDSCIYGGRRNAR